MNDDEDMFPAVPSDLLKELNSRYPDRCPGVLDTDREIWMNAGRRSVVQLLTQKFEEQNTSVLIHNHNQ